MGLESMIHDYIIEHGREEFVGLHERGVMNIHSSGFVLLELRTTAFIIASLSLRDIVVGFDVKRSGRGYLIESKWVGDGSRSKVIGETSTCDVKSDPESDGADGTLSL